METPAKVRQFLSKTGNFYIYAGILIVGILLFFTMKVSITHANDLRQRNHRIQEIQSLSQEWNELDQVYI